MKKLFLLLLLSFYPTETKAQINFDRPKTESPLPNPYSAPAARDVVVQEVIAMIKDMGIDLETDKTRKEEGLLITKPVIFTKGTVVRSQLGHFSECPASEASTWTRGRYRLQFVIEPVDPAHSKISLTAKIEGETQGQLGNTWVECRSNGRLEDQILRKLVDRIR
jgi:hypothetical protein